MTEGLGYSEALEELEQILNDLESADTDVDLLAQRVARGAELVQFCRSRLEVVAADVDSVLSDADTDSDADLDTEPEMASEDDQ